MKRFVLISIFFVATSVLWSKDFDSTYWYSRVPKNEKTVTFLKYGKGFFYIEISSSIHYRLNNIKNERISEATLHYKKFYDLLTDDIYKSWKNDKFGTFYVNDLPVDWTFEMLPSESVSLDGTFIKDGKVSYKCTVGGSEIFLDQQIVTLPFGSGIEYRELLETYGKPDQIRSTGGSSFMDSNKSNYSSAWDYSTNGKKSLTKRYFVAYKKWPECRIYLNKEYGSVKEIISSQVFERSIKTKRGLFDW